MTFLNVRIALIRRFVADKGNENGSRDEIFCFDQCKNVFFRKQGSDSGLKEILESKTEYYV